MGIDKICKPGSFSTRADPRVPKSCDACTSRCFCDCLTSAHVSPFACIARFYWHLLTVRRTLTRDTTLTHTRCLFARRLRRETYIPRYIYENEKYSIWTHANIYAWRLINSLFHDYYVFLRFQASQKNRSLKWYIYALRRYFQFFSFLFFFFPGFITATCNFIKLSQRERERILFITKF